MPDLTPMEKLRKAQGTLAVTVFCETREHAENLVTEASSLLSEAIETLEKRGTVAE